MRQPERADPSMELPWVAPLHNEPRRITSEPTPTPSRLLKVPLIPPTDSHRELLGIDIENKPLWYGGSDFVYDNVICVTPKWVGGDNAEPIWLDWSHKDATLVRRLEPLRNMIEEADALLGHNFKHDWRGIQSVFNHLQQRFLPKRPIVDTMRCIPSGMPRSLEWLCDMFELGDKPHVSARTWIAAIERKEPWAIQKVKDRNVADVILTERLYEKERELGWLTPRITKPMTTSR
jgi:hypothetical protein